MAPGVGTSVQDDRRVFLLATPIIRGGVPPATETAILNLGGGGVLVALGVALVRSPKG